jgi:cobalt/nickel transport system ATP-binding protein
MSDATPHAARRTAGPWAIEAEAVSYTYPDGIAALCDLTFRAAEGSLVAVMGANGSGKTTLMKVLMRLLRPQQGTVRLGATGIERLPAAELYRRVGMVFQNPADQLFAPTVEQDVAFGPSNSGLPEAEIAARIEEALAAVDALPLRHRPIHHLSFGEQKRICLAGVLAMQPGILVLDEPTAGLDPASEAQMRELLLRLNRQRKITVILSTHSVDRLPVEADWIYVLARGRVLREGPPQEVLSDAAGAAEAGLRLPLVTQLFDELRRRHGVPIDRLPLTLDDAQRQILRWLANAEPDAPPRKPGEPS